MSSNVFDNSEVMATCESSGIEFEKINSKLLEILRKLGMKFPPGTLPSQLESIRYIFGIEISCRLLSLTFNRQVLMKLSRLKENDYYRGINLIKTALHLSWEKVSVIDLLAIRFGTTFKTCAQQLLERYISKCNHVSKSDLIDSPAFQAAAFFITLKQRKITTDKAHLIQTAEVEKGSFLNAFNDINKVLGLATDDKNKGKSGSRDNATIGGQSSSTFGGTIAAASVETASTALTSAAVNLTVKSSSVTSKALGLNAYLRSKHTLLPTSNKNAQIENTSVNHTIASSSSSSNNTDNNSNNMNLAGKTVHANNSHRHYAGSASASASASVATPISTTSNSGQPMMSNKYLLASSSSSSSVSVIGQRDPRPAQLSAVSLSDHNHENLNPQMSNKRTYSQINQRSVNEHSAYVSSSVTKPVTESAASRREILGNLIPKEDNNKDQDKNNQEREIEAKKKHTDRELYLKIRHEKLAKLR